MPVTPIYVWTCRSIKISDEHKTAISAVVRKLAGDEERSCRSRKDLGAEEHRTSDSDCKRDVRQS